MVGARRFELPTSATPLQRATRLRHAPTGRERRIGRGTGRVNGAEAFRGPAGQARIRSVARPLRNQWRARTAVRRRHRTWVTAMVFATLGWGTWWTTVVLLRLAPDWAPSFRVAYAVAGSFAAVGLFFGVFSIRAKRVWVLLAAVPIFANGSLLLLPTLLGDLRSMPVRAVEGEP